MRQHQNTDTHNGEFCSCGQDAVTCQKCAQRVCGSQTDWIAPTGNVCCHCLTAEVNAATAVIHAANVLSYSQRPAQTINHWTMVSTMQLGNLQKALRALAAAKIERNPDAVLATLRGEREVAPKPSYEAELRAYEEAHRVWMDTPVHNNSAAKAAMIEARDVLEAARKAVAK